MFEHRSLYASVDGVPAARKVAFLINLDAAPEGGLGFVSVNGDAAVGSAAFRRAVPDGSRLADALDAADVDG